MGRAEDFRARQLAVLDEIHKDVQTEPFTDPAKLNRALLVARQRGHLISPVDQVDYIPQMHAVSLRYVFLDPFGDKDTYSPHWCKDGEVAPAQVGILKLWKQASGSDVFSRRTDDRLEPLCQTYQVGVNLRGIDGRDNLTTKSREVDLREGSAQVANMKPRQMAGARENVGTLAETKAKLRAIRSALALSQKYTIEDLTKPFIIPVLVALVDTSDPVIRKLVAVKALGLEGALYGERPQLTGGTAPATDTDVPPGVDAETGEVIDTDVIPDDDPAEANSVAGEYDPADYAEPDPEPAGPRCGCSCGCGADVNAEAAKLTQQRRGGVRCAACYPGARFDAERHKGMKSLGLHPDISAADAASRRAS